MEPKKNIIFLTCTCGSISKLEIDLGLDENNLPIIKNMKNVPVTVEDLEELKKEKEKVLDQIRKQKLLMSQPNPDDMLN